MVACCKLCHRNCGAAKFSIGSYQKMGGSRLHIFGSCRSRFPIVWKASRRFPGERYDDLSPWVPIAHCAFCTNVTMAALGSDSAYCTKSCLNLEKKKKQSILIVGLPRGQKKRSESGAMIPSSAPAWELIK